jgi:hypothetical protein
MYNSEVQEIIALSNINGGLYWSRNDGDIHAPTGFSTIDVLNTLGEIGVHFNDFEIIQKAIDFIFNLYDPKGCFRYSSKSSKLPCITARILTAFGRLGYMTDDRIERCFQYFLDTQQKDGGWRCATVKLGKSPETDSSNPGTTLYILDAFRFRKNSTSECSQLNQAIEFLLSHWETRLPLGPCNFGIGSRFLSVEYPFLRYNLFYYVYILSKYKMANKDNRYNKALNILLLSTENDKLVLTNPHKSWRKYSFAQKNQHSEIATRRLQEIINETV